MKETDFMFVFLEVAFKIHWLLNLMSQWV